MASSSNTGSVGAGVRPDVSLLIPAFNESDALERTLSAIEPHRAAFREIVVVDDGSTDDTSAIAEAGGARVIRHARNRGYGAALKTGLRETDTQFVMMMDSDGQHPPEAIPEFLNDFEDRDAVIGLRSKESHASLIRRPGKWLLGVVANHLAGEKIPDLNCGMRLVRRDFAERYVPILPDGFSLSTTLTIAALKDRAHVRWVPIVGRRREGRASSVRMVRDGANTLLLILRVIMLFDPLKIFLPIAGLLLCLGTGLTLYESLHWPVFRLQLSDASVFSFLTAVLVFLFGLVADQLAAMRKQMR